MPNDLAVPLVLCTIWSTGTRFFVDLLKRHYADKVTVKDGQQLFWLAHCESDQIDKVLELKAAGCLLVTTWRQHEHLIASWRRRWPGKDRLLLEQLGIWIEEIRPRADVCLSISESLDRNTRLARLGLLLGEQFTTDWRPIG